MSELRSLKILSVPSVKNGFFASLRPGGVLGGWCSALLCSPLLCSPPPALLGDARGWFFFGFWFFSRGGGGLWFGFGCLVGWFGWLWEGLKLAKNTSLGPPIFSGLRSSGQLISYPQITKSCRANRETLCPWTEVDLSL